MQRVIVEGTDLCILAGYGCHLEGVQLVGQRQGFRPVLQVLAHLQSCSGAGTSQKQLLQHYTAQYCSVLREIPMLDHSFGCTQQVNWSL